MPFQPDPSLRFSHPANRGVVSFLRCQAERARDAQARGRSAENDRSDRSARSDEPGALAPVTADGYFLHTHAGLCRQLWEACACLPPDQNSLPCEALVYGVALLAARGIIFALAYGVAPGEDWLAIRLAGDDAIAAYRAGAEPDMGLGDDWLCLDPRQPASPVEAAREDLTYWLERAYQNALALPERPYG